MSTILDLAKEHFISKSELPQKVADTNNGEWAGPCPSCGGTDRFRYWPYHPNSHKKGGSFWCRRCEIHGDAIQFAKDFLNWGFREACDFLEVTPGNSRGEIRLGRPWSPKEHKSPEAKWREMAERFVSKCFSNAEKRNFVGFSKRGLTEETCQEFSLGWNPKDGYVHAKSWGVEAEIDREKLKFKQLWLPAGLVLPHFVSGHLVSIKIRRAGYGRSNDKGPKYLIVRGSVMMPWLFQRDPSQNKPVVVVESEFDGLLIHQEAGDLVDTVALGAAQTKPDGRVNRVIEQAPQVLVALDCDKAGAEAARWWEEIYDQAERVVVPFGKDPGEYFEQGGNLRNLVLACLPDQITASESSGMKNPVPSTDSVKPATPSSEPADVTRPGTQKAGTVEATDANGNGNLSKSKTRASSSEAKTLNTTERKPGLSDNGVCLRAHPCRHASRVEGAGLLCGFVSEPVIRLDKCPLQVWEKFPRPGGKYQDVVLLDPQ